MTIMPPAQLWIGDQQQLTEHAYAYLEEQFGSSVTSTRQIKNRQHHAVLWVAPEKSLYRRVDLEPVFKQLAFALQPGEKFFFVLERADALSIACANSLLKALEEPPAGYHFILLAQRRELVLPTVLSRSVVTDFGGLVSSGLDEFLALFKREEKVDADVFMRLFTKAQITEYHTRSMVDQLYEHWSSAYVHAVQAGNEMHSRHAEKKLAILTYLADRMPMPGSTKLFWRTLFLTMNL